jgi:ankyrin repeat protein
LLKHGADANLASNIIQPVAAAARGGQRGGIPTVGGGGRGQGRNADQAAAGAAAQAQAQQNLGEGGGKGGGNPKGRLTPLMYAARQGSFEAATALVDGGANLNALNGDNSTALFLAIINGKFDIARMLVERGADIAIATMDGGTPLYAVVNTQWARKSFQPQPSARYEKTTYLQLMNILLDRGADPNARLGRELWFAEYNRDLQTVTTAGATAFWKCADVGDVDGMRLLVSRGANPNIATTEGVTPLLIAAGAGVHGNDDVTAPMGRLAAVKYLVEELHADVNVADTGNGGRGQGLVGAATEPQSAASGATPTGTQQQPPSPRPANGGFTALHNAAARGDNAMILYLVSKGARVDAVSKGGVTVADMANGPRQRIQPYPETVALLEQLGSKNSHKCVSC